VYGSVVYGSSGARRKIGGVVFHSDKGGEYTGDLFAKACKALGVTQSMGRVGSALDNAAAESFNSTLEWELLSRRDFATKAEARRAVARFIDAYNQTRRHSSCEMKPPVVYERLLADRAAEAPKPRMTRERLHERPHRCSQSRETVFRWTPVPPKSLPPSNHEKLKPTIRNPPQLEGKPR